MRVLLAPVVLACVLASAACGGDKVVTAPAPPPPARTAPTIGSVGVAAERSVPFAENDFAENDRNRDPFRSFASLFVPPVEPPAPNQLRPILPQYAIDELKLVAIVLSGDYPRAMITDPNGKGWVVKPGDYIGRAETVHTGGSNGTDYQLNWRVDRVRDGGSRSPGKIAPAFRPRRRRSSPCIPTWTGRASESDGSDRVLPIAWDTMSPCRISAVSRRSRTPRKSDHAPHPTRGASLAPAPGVHARFIFLCFRRACFAAAACVASLASLARVASADSSHADARLEIVTVDGRSWDAVLREIQSNVATHGRSYDVGVALRGANVACGDYELSFDPVASQAFAVERCDEATRMTRLRVVDRSALFARGDVVPEARTASIHATLRQSATALGGGDAPAAGSKIWCSVALQPYLRDDLHGVTVPLSPDRFELRPLEEHVHAAPDGSGWIARGESRMAVHFRYEVIDRTSGARVLEDVATLACADAPATPLVATPDLLPLPSLVPTHPPLVDVSAPASHRPARAPGIVFMSAGALGLVAAATYGVLALSQKGVLNSLCGADRTSCPPSAQQNLDTMQTDSVVSDVGLALGVVGVAVGFVLLLYPKYTTRPASASGVRVDLWASLGSGGLRGTF